MTSLWVCVGRFFAAIAPRSEDKRAVTGVTFAGITRLVVDSLRHDDVLRGVRVARIMYTCIKWMDGWSNEGRFEMVTESRRFGVVRDIFTLK